MSTGRRWIRDEYKDRPRSGGETYGAWHLHRMVKSSEDGGWQTQRVCDWQWLYVDRERLESDRVRVERVPAYEAYSCPLCVWAHDAPVWTYDKAVTTTAGFDVPEHVVDPNACESLRRDLMMSNRARDEWEERYRSREREIERLHKRVLSALGERDTTRAERDDLERERVAWKAAAGTAKSERDNIARVHGLMKTARERDHLSFDRMRKELADVVRERDEARRERDALRSTAAPAPVSRYGAVRLIEHEPLPFEPYCALCPNGGRPLIRRAARDNAVLALVGHVVGMHGASVPAVVDPDGVTHAPCTVPGCGASFEDDTVSVRRKVVRHEIEWHA